MGKFIDIKDQQFGEIIAREYIGKGFWNCECSCGKFKKIQGSSLRNGLTKSCGHATTGFKDLTDMTFNELTPVKYLGDSYWECKCSCGETTRVHRRNLMTGDVKSCGHLKAEKRKELDKLVGKTFGKLEVLEYIGDKKYRCRCNCKNKTIKDVFKHNLISGGTSSCGCDQYNMISKQDIMDAVNKYTKEYKEAPFIQDIAQYLPIGKDQIKRYVDRYEIHNIFNKTYGSRYEKDICSLINVEVKLHDRKQLQGQELDMYLPSIYTAIEFNGNYWHSDLVKDMYYHQQKTIDCWKNRIRLIHIFEYEWENRREQIEYLIKSLNNDGITCIGARKTNVRFIDNIDAIAFADKYHLQGGVNSSINIGCFYNEQLIGLMAFSKPRFNSNYEYEVTRVCWKEGFRVSGGLEKMFSLFLAEHNPKSVLTYVDISKFSGNSYSKIGFKPVQGNAITKPNYIWIKEGTNHYMTRYQTQKHKLIEQGLGTKEQTEDEIMRKMGYFKVYDSGNLKMEWTNS